jgi:LysM repeat protein
MKAIAEANPGVDSTRLKLGQKLKIPAGGTSASAVAPSATAVPVNGSEKPYSVKSGDTLMKIAREHGTTVKALRAANNLKTDQIKVAQKLKIPAKAPAVPAPEPVATTLPPVTPPPPPVFTPGVTNP